ncbi:MAG: glycosyltransferase [Candidatus Kapabacteria bacterium]|nr:glycosyltransferase [Candidatus Kapabacteria bacterium]
MEVERSYQLNLIWEGPLEDASSLATINREHAWNLARSGKVHLVLVPPAKAESSILLSEKLPRLRSYDVRHIEPELVRAPVVWVRHQWPPNGERPQGATWVIMQPWEMSLLPTDFVDIFNRADEVWTPSTFCRRVFVESGVDPNKVQVIPNGVDPAIFTPAGEVPALPTKKRFKFLYVGGTTYRKGFDILLEAYVRAFTAADDVCLVVKDCGTRSYYQGQTAEELIAKVRSMPNAPEILYTDVDLSEEQMAQLYRACDVFVAPYRGEGFCMPALEAMACGLPVVVTEGGGTDDFVDEVVGWLLPAERRSLGSQVDGRSFPGEVFLLEPDSDVLVETLQYCYHHPNECRDKGIAASLRARTEWTWNRSTLKLLSRLDALMGTETARPSSLILSDADDTMVLFARAEQAHSSGRIDDAIEYYHQCFMRGDLPIHFKMLALHRMASFCLVEEEYDLCRQYLDKAESFVPQHPDTRYVRSVYYAAQEQWHEALNELNALLTTWQEVRFESRIGMTLDRLLCDSARALFNLGFPDDARQLYEKALEYNPNNPDACYGAALCFKGVGNVVKARTMLEWAIRLRPEYAAVLDVDSSE